MKFIFHMRVRERERVSELERRVASNRGSNRASWRSGLQGLGIGQVAHSRGGCWVGISWFLRGGGEAGRVASGSMVLGGSLDGGLEARKSCLLVNAPLICRAASRVPFSVLNSGHAAWISSKKSRNPRLTARHGGGHMPTRVVMSRNLDLPEEANLWDMSKATTIVVTQRGARRSFQKHLASKGIEVVEFDILNPRDVMEYFHDRGYLSVLWECGGTLAASAISAGVIHKVFPFVAPKIIGGKNAPSPVGELGMVEMSQALDLIDVCYEQVGPDMLISGFLQPIPDLTLVIPSVEETYAIDPTVTPYEPRIIFFYKTWDLYGAFSNFSPHPIQMPDENGNYVTWLSMEHYYQAQKFFGVNVPVVRDCVLKIKSAKIPEEAARIGRSMQRQHPDLKRKVLVYDKDFVSFFGLFQGSNDSWNRIFDPKFGSNDSLGFMNYLLLLLFY
ncbi:hypothetical protein UlMin_022769 [Ulmus minor]